jgi:hypothetical protein
VRLFKKMREMDAFWIEQPKYQKTIDLSAICPAIAEAVPYASSTIPSQCAKPYWGQRGQQIKEQLKRYVPPQYVPDEYEVRAGGVSGTLSDAAQALISDTIPAVDDPAAEEDDGPAQKKAKIYDKDIHDDDVVAACPKNARGDPMFVSKAAQVQPIINAAMPGTGYRVNNMTGVLKRLLKEGRLVQFSIESD